MPSISTTHSSSSGSGLGFDDSLANDPPSSSRAGRAAQPALDGEQCFQLMPIRSKTQTRARTHACMGVHTYRSWVALLSGAVGSSSETQCRTATCRGLPNCADAQLASSPLSPRLNPRGSIGLAALASSSGSFAAAAAAAATAAAPRNGDDSHADASYGWAADLHPVALDSELRAFVAWPR